ncbi:hypothetical protein HMPREF1992_02199 [Selenomonas sp. oral taxon 892 str. F0426]|nr:hypothetical protein HMPREF1992_02199 [Selenomonas sp. oral taxon 892 str. F0426]
MLIMRTDDLRSSLFLQTVEKIEKDKRIHAAGAGNEKRTSCIEKIIRGQNAFNLFLQNRLLIQKKHSAWSAFSLHMLRLIKGENAQVIDISTSL